MSIFPFFKKKSFFTAKEQEQIVEAIRVAEKETSGEIRIYVESKNRFVDPLDRAAEVFFKLKMEETEHRNGVLLYIAMKDQQLALFGDEGIHQKVGSEFWKNAVKNMISQFASQNIITGIEQCVLQIGQTLKATFPYEASTDKNELPDEIVFGR